MKKRVRIVNNDYRASKASDHRRSRVNSAGNISMLLEDSRDAYSTQYRSKWTSLLQQGGLRHIGKIACMPIDNLRADPILTVPFVEASFCHFTWPKQCVITEFIGTDERSARVAVLIFSTYLDLASSLIFIFVAGFGICSLEIRTTSVSTSNFSWTDGSVESDSGLFHTSESTTLQKS